MREIKNIRGLYGNNFYFKDFRPRTYKRTYVTNIRQNIRPNIRGKFGANIRGNIRPEYRPKFVLEAGCGVVWTCRDDDHDDERWRWRWRWRWRALHSEPADGVARAWPGSKIRRVVVIDLKQRLFQLQAELDNYSNRPKADAVLFRFHGEKLASCNRNA